jgi:hypothetical protein
VCGLVLFAAGCATRIANVDHRMLLPQGGDRIELESQQLFVMPIALGQPEPAFPSMQPGIAEPVEVTVCAELWLSTDGDITRVAPFDDAPGCAPGDDAGALAYAQAAAEALRRWELTPAMICDFPPQALDKRARGDCTGPEVEVRRVPVRLNYAFTFSSRDGKRRVGVARRSQQEGGAPAHATR